MPPAASTKIFAPYHVTVGAAAVHLGPASGNSRAHSHTLKAVCTPGEKVYLGASSAVTTADGYPLEDGETFPFEVFDASKIWAIGTAGGQKVVVLPRGTRGT